MSSLSLGHRDRDRNLKRTFDSTDRDRDRDRDSNPGTGTGNLDEWETDRPKVPEVQLQPAVVQRNKRLFAGLMGHLDLAKRRLESDSTRIDKRNQATQAAAQRNQATSKAIRESFQQKQSSEKRKAQLTRDIQRLRKSLVELQQALEDHVEKLQRGRSYLRTNTTPQLLWLPSSHNDTTRDLLASRESEVDGIIAERETTNHQKTLDIQEQLKALECELKAADSGANETETEAAESSEFVENTQECAQSDENLLSS